MELLWRNGHVVVQSQAAPRKPAGKEAAQQQDNDAAAWFQYPAEDLFSELFGATAKCKEEEERQCGAAAAEEEGVRGGRRRRGRGGGGDRRRVDAHDRVKLLREQPRADDDAPSAEREGQSRQGPRRGDGDLVVDAADEDLRRQDRHRRRPPERQAEAARRNGDRGTYAHCMLLTVCTEPSRPPRCRTRSSRRRDVRASAEDDDRQAAARRGSAQPLGAGT
jgi:hypothetical protein